MYINLGDKFEEEQISVEVSYLLSLSNFRWSSKVVTKEPTTTTTTKPIDSNNGCRVYNNSLLQTLPFHMPHVHSHYHTLLCSALYTLAAASSAALLYHHAVSNNTRIAGNKINMLWMVLLLPHLEYDNILAAAAAADLVSSQSFLFFCCNNWRRKFARGDDDDDDDDDYFALLWILLLFYWVQYSCCCTCISTLIVRTLV